MISKIVSSAKWWASANLELEDRQQRERVVERMGAETQFPQAAKQLREPQISSQTLVERIFVKDHAAGEVESTNRLRGRIIARTNEPSAGPRPVAVAACHRPHWQAPHRPAPC